MAEEKEISTKDYLDLLAKEIKADNRNVTKQAVEEALDEYHIKTIAPLADSVKKIRERQLLRDGATLASLGGHGWNVLAWVMHFLK